MSDSEKIMFAAASLGAAAKGYASACRDSADDASVVIEAGRYLVEAVLEYEKFIQEETGWSCPIRHLGQLPLYADGGGDRLDVQNGIDPERRVSVELAAKYRLQVDESELVRFAGMKFGDEPPDVEQAVRVLFESDSWDPQSYPPGLLYVKNAEVDISIDAG